MLTVILLLSLHSLDDVSIGPDKGKPLPPLSITLAVGDAKGEKKDLAKLLDKEAGVILFVSSDKWDRPVARFLREVDQHLSKEATTKNTPARKAYIVWVTKDVKKATDYLPLVQQSIKLGPTQWAIFEGEVYDAKDWVLSGDLPLQFLLTKDGKVTQGTGLKSVQEDTIKKIPEYLK